MFPYCPSGEKIIYGVSRCRNSFPSSCDTQILSGMSTSNMCIRPPPLLKSKSAKNLSNQGYSVLPKSGRDQILTLRIRAKPLSGQLIPSLALISCPPGWDGDVSDKAKLVPSGRNIENQLEKELQYLSCFSLLPFPTLQP